MTAWQLLLWFTGFADGGETPTPVATVFTPIYGAPATFLAVEGAADSHRIEGAPARPHLLQGSPQ